MKSRFIIVYKHTRRDVHSVDEAKALFHLALAQTTVYLRRYVYEATARWHIEPQFLSIALHRDPSKNKSNISSLYS
jgi:hypothetical protein